MAFSDGTLAPIVSSPAGANVFIYTEDQAITAIRASGYFDEAVDYGMVDGDIVLIVANNAFGMSDIVVTGSTYAVGESVTSA